MPSNLGNGPPAMRCAVNPCLRLCNLGSTHISMQAQQRLAALPVRIQSIAGQCRIQQA